MPIIDAQATALSELNTEVATRLPEPENWQRLLASAHFTQTQKNRLRVLWRYLLNRGFDAEQLLADHAQLPAARIIAQLESLSYADSERL